MHLAIIGTGIVGTCVGAWLMRDGHRITFVSNTAPGAACSFGNAGSMSPSACLPVGMPGMWRQVPRWLADANGPLAIRPAYLPLLLPWLARFLRHSRPAEVTRIASALRGLLAPIFECYEPLLERAGAQGLVRRTGCLYVYSSSEAARRWQWGMNLRRSLGVALRDIDAAELDALEPDLRGRFRFGILAPENGSTLDPEQLVKDLHARTLVDGASMVAGEVAGFERRAGAVKALTLADGRRIECEGVVVAAGAWSGALTRQLGLSIPLETQRGYHVTVQSNNLALKHTVMAVEYNLMVNPMAIGLRLAGSVEFAGLKPPPNYARADVLLAKGRELFPQLDVSRRSRWMGHRPCLPDSLPVIGRAPRIDNVWLAFGHGHIGMCAAASTGREVAHLVAGRTPQIDLKPFRPERF